MAAAPQAPSQTMPTVRDRVATAAARGAATAIKATGSGRGSTLPGKVANLISASFLHDRAAELPEGFVLVTGTNGKTTTAAMAAHVLRARGRSLVHNVEGANLLSGIASAFAAQGRASLGLLEADEAIVPRAVAALGTPRVVVLTNLFRDQLDRYGEVDRLAEGWLDALRRARAAPSWSPTPTTRWSPTSPARRGSRRCTSASSPARRRRRSPTARSATPSSARPAASSSSTAPAGCRSSATTAAGAATSHGPARDLEARDLLLSSAQVSARRPQLVRAGGALRALARGARDALRLQRARRLRARREAGRAAADGPRRPVDLPAGLRPRQLRTTYRGATVRVSLVKNPAGMNQTLRTLAALQGDRALVFVLNDNIADGRDISWIWDADLESLLPPARTVVACGQREAGMALRLKYAGVDEERLLSTARLEDGLALALERGHREIDVLPTYTALEEVRVTLAAERRAG